MNNKIPVFYASDENYVKPLAVSMASVLANTNAFIEFYILENNISESSKQKIEKLKNHFQNFSVKYIPIDMDTFKNLPNLNWYSLNMYSRFYIPELESSIDKAVYLDVDIILKSDILKLYDIDIEEYPLGAVVGEKKYLNSPDFIKHIKNLKISNKHIYFGSGVLLINSKIWREQKIFKKLLKVISSNKHKLKYPDQDALNIIFDSNYKKIDLNWNRDLGCIEDEYKFDKHVIDRCFLIHYDGKSKPWNSDVFASEIFWNYAQYTEFENELKESLKQIKRNRAEHYHYLIDINNKNESRSINFNLAKPKTRILDVGCACGDLGRVLKTHKKCTCYGLEFLEESVNIAKQSGAYEEVYQCDLNSFNLENYPDLKQGFDHIICGDILEHLYNPKELLLKLIPLLNDNGTFIISIPNISHASIKFMLLQDKFEYEEYGILDRTHIRFYTLNSFLKLLLSLNLNITSFNYTVCNMQGLFTNIQIKQIPLGVRLSVLKDKQSYCFQYIFELSKMSESTPNNQTTDINTLIRSASNYQLLRKTKHSDILDCFRFFRRNKQ